MKLEPLALAAALSLAAPLAIADDLFQTLTFAPNGGVFTADFTATHLETSFFVDTFDFVLPGTSAGTVTAELISDDADLGLLGGFLAGESFEFASSGGSQTASLSVAGLSGAQSLSVFGIAADPFGETVALTASYSGTLTFTPEAVAAIPEPQTYALMLAGLGLVGWMAGRRRPS